MTEHDKDGRNASKTLQLSVRDYLVRGFEWPYICPRAVSQLFLGASFIFERFLQLLKQGLGEISDQRHGRRPARRHAQGISSLIDDEYAIRS